jgi:hypothetical protein
MASSSLNIRIRHFKFMAYQYAASTTTIQWALVRLTSAGTGGTNITSLIAPYDSAADTTNSTAMTLPSAKGIEGTILLPGRMAFPSGAPDVTTYDWEWTQQPNTKPIIIPAGAVNGVAFKNLSGLTSANVLFYVEYQETSF